MISVTLPWPAKALWPNGRAVWQVKAQQVKLHRAWARNAVQGEHGARQWPQTGYRVTITAHPKPKGPAPDADNTVAACKAFFDGIADAMGVDDRTFTVAPVICGDRRPHGAIVISIEAIE